MNTRHSNKMSSLSEEYINKVRESGMSPEEFQNEIYLIACAVGATIIDSMDGKPVSFESIDVDGKIVKLEISKQ